MVEIAYLIVPGGFGYGVSKTKVSFNFRIIRLILSKH